MSDPITTLTLKCSNRVLSIKTTNGELFSGAMNVDRVLFEFDSEWNDYIKFATFIVSDSEFYHVELDNNYALIPRPVLERERSILIGVFGTAENQRISSSALRVRVKRGGFTDGSETEEGVDYYTEFLRQLSTYARELASVSNALDGKISNAGGVILTNHIAVNAVTAEKIANGAVTTEKLAAYAVTNAKIAQGAITEGKIASEAITTEKMESYAVTASILATDAVTTPKIQDEAVTEAKLSLALQQGLIKVTVWDYELSSQNNFTVPDSYAGKLGDIVIISTGTGTGGRVFVLYRILSQYGLTQYFWKSITELSQGAVSISNISAAAFDSEPISASGNLLTSGVVFSTLQDYWYRHDIMDGDACTLAQLNNAIEQSDHTIHTAVLKANELFTGSAYQVVTVIQYNSSLRGMIAQRDGLYYSLKNGGVWGDWSPAISTQSIKDESITFAKLAPAVQTRITTLESDVGDIISSLETVLEEGV